MNKVYEDFITEMIEELVEEDSSFQDLIVEKQQKFDSLVRENRRLITRPDVILRSKETDKYPLIIDAKYKRQENNADFYQVIAYALAIPTAKACCLIYPSDVDIDQDVLTLDPDKFGGDRGEIKLHIIKINLHWDDKLEFNDFVSKIKNDIRDKLYVCCKLH